jgi:hypothetical protein
MSKLATLTCPACGAGPGVQMKVTARERPAPYPSQADEQ